MSQSHRWIGRREMMQYMAAGGVGALTSALGASQPAEAAEISPAFDPGTALQRLLEGNQRFVGHKSLYPDQSSARLREIAQAQHPFATILSCADSRVPPELLFDQGFGDIFDIRIAGNIVTPEALGSIEYAAVLLETPLLMVLGHERCGAVTAAVTAEPLPGQIGTFVKYIQPALDRIKDNPGDPVENGVVANVRYQVGQLLQLSPLLAERVAAEKLKIVGGRYDLDSGEVSILG